MQWGIGARLGIAFVVVAVLAVAANLLVEHQISVIRTTRLVKVPVQLPPTQAVSAASPASAPSAPGAPSIAALTAAVERYQAALRGRLDVDSSERRELLTGAAQDLEREAQKYRAAPGDAKARSRGQDLHTRLNAYRGLGDELIRIADLRQNSRRLSSERLEALDSRTKAALAQSWKIFGRVISHKSLVSVNASLDDIRRRIDGQGLSGDEAGGGIASVDDSISALIGLLASNQASLLRLEGKDWMGQMQADATALAASQRSYNLMDTRWRAQLPKFARDSLELMALLRTSQATRLTRLTQLPHALTPAVAKDSGQTKDSGPTKALETTSTNFHTDGHAMLIRWISAIVLSLLLGVLVWTVVSILGPARRLRAATQRLASGATGVQVHRGGVRELDDLAMSFNEMATQLAAAQALAHSYQLQLESRVEERTRELQHLALHDPLTQLPNRRQLFTHLEAALRRAAENGSFVGVFFLDLDNFKTINDSLGHAFGDRVLVAIAERLRETAGQRGFAARLGGDEFTVVCDSASDLEEVRNVGWDLVRAFQRSLRVDDRELMVSISVGASLYPVHETSADALLRAADTALFRAKALGRSQLTVFSADLLAAASARFTTEQGLRHALERGEFELVYQPEVDARTFTVGLVEALLRWRMPDGRLASPAEFLAIAEESGLIMDISDWVLRSAVAEAARWHSGAWPQVRVAINLSSRQILDKRFVERLLGLLQEHRLPARCIEIELTENVLQTSPGTTEVLCELRERGVAVALDDFGTGYSTLASLEQLPLTRVKLDRTLVASIHTSERSAAIARAIVGLCQNIGLEVTAEGIECPEQLAVLLDQPSMYLQGYLLARPAPAGEMLAVIAAMRAHMESLLLSLPSPQRLQPQQPSAARRRPTFVKSK